MTAPMMFKPVGYVRSNADVQELRSRQAVAEIVVFEEFSGALEGVEDFSHLFIIYWFHEHPGSPKPGWKAHPRGREDMPLVGVFATRVPGRPNGVGLTVVELLERRGNTLVVKGLDAFDRSPIIDIKPYDPWDVKEGIHIPDWWTKLEKEKMARGGNPTP
ncbi:MAG: tRNA (N6-threonylcarbamoyladenosine(37)-N6)-methyltransferase TrmO [Candidatus Bathyarchaeia archaeon]